MKHPPTTLPMMPPTDAGGGSIGGGGGGSGAQVAMAEPLPPGFALHVPPGHVVAAALQYPMPVQVHEDEMDGPHVHLFEVGSIHSFPLLSSFVYESPFPPAEVASLRKVPEHEPKPAPMVTEEQQVVCERITTTLNEKMSVRRERPIRIRVAQ